MKNTIKWTTIIFCKLLLFFVQALFAADNSRLTLFSWPLSEQMRRQDCVDTSRELAFPNRRFVDDGLVPTVRPMQTAQPDFGSLSFGLDLTRPVPSIQFEQRDSSAVYAHNLVCQDYAVAHIKQTIDNQLVSIAHDLQENTMYARLDALDRLQALQRNCDIQFAALLERQRAVEYDTGTSSNDPFISAVNSLQQELHNVVGSIQEKFFDRSGNFLNLNKEVTGVQEIIENYKERYQGDSYVTMSRPNSVILQRIEQNTFFSALLKYHQCIKQGDLTGAHNVLREYGSMNRKQNEILQSYKNEVLNEFGVPKIWESHPQWKDYQERLSMRPCPMASIVKELQQEHNAALGICQQVGINGSTATQINCAHQLRTYQQDPSFKDIAFQVLQKPEMLQSALDVFGQRADTLAQIKKIIAHNPDVAPLLNEHMDEFLACNHDPKLMPTVEQMAHNPNAVESLNRDLLQRYVFVHDVREWLGHELFSNQAEQVTYQLYNAQTDAQRIDALSSLSVDHELQGVQDAYHSFYDEVAHLPKIFNYDDRLLETKLPDVIATTAFTRERTLYTHVMTRPIHSEAQLAQAQQCISFLRDACVPQEQQDAYRDLACTVCRTYLNQPHNYARDDYAQQVDLFNKAHQAIRHNQPVEVSSPDQHAGVQQQIEVNLASVDYVQLHDQVARTCDAIEQQTGKVSEYYQSREQALQQMAQGDLLVHHKEYSSSPQAVDVLKQAGYDPAQFTSCKGNLVQQDNHAKLVNSLNKLAHKPARTQAAQQLKDGVLDCAQAGNALNQAGNIKEAMMMSDICHVAVDHIWQFVDSGVSLSTGFGEGLIQGVAVFYNTEVSSMPGDGELTLSAYTQPSDALRDVARAETSQAVYEVLALLKDVGEVSLEAGYGAADSIQSMPHLVSDMVDVTKALGTTLATVGADSLMLLDATEHGSLKDFTQQLHKMNADCHQIKEGLDAFTTQLGEHIKAHMPQDGQITKAHAKMAVRAGAHMVTEGLVMNLGMKGVSALCKGVSSHVGQMSKELGRIQEIKDISMAEVRNALLAAQLERSPLAAQAPTLYKGTMWAHVVKDQVKMLQPIVNNASSLKGIEGVIRPLVARSAEAESRLASTIQKAQHWLSVQARPGYIQLPGSTQNRQPKDNVKADQNSEMEAQRESIRQIIMNRERDITIEEARILGCRGESVGKVKTKAAGKIIIHTESMGGAEKGQQVFSELVNEKLETAKLLKPKEVEPLDNGGKRIFYKFDDGITFQSRSSGKSGHFKVDIEDKVNNIKEKITFI